MGGMDWDQLFQHWEAPCEIVSLTQAVSDGKELGDHGVTEWLQQADPLEIRNTMEEVSQVLKEPIRLMSRENVPAAAVNDDERDDWMLEDDPDMVYYEDEYPGDREEPIAAVEELADVSCLLFKKELLFESIFGKDGCLGMNPFFLQREIQRDPLSSGKSR